jgi:DNA-binding transcriptional regulator YhcF (GntR family)
MGQLLAQWVRPGVGAIGEPATITATIHRMGPEHPSSPPGRTTRVMITLDTTSPIPPFEQVRAQLAAQITDHILVAGTRLPTVRHLADDLGLAVNTIARAYRELESAGLVETRGRGGTVVTAAGDTARTRLQQTAQTYAATTRELGINPNEAIDLVRAALQSPGRDSRMHPAPRTLQQT